MMTARISALAVLAFAVSLSFGQSTQAQDSSKKELTDTKAAYEDGGRWFTAEDIPTYKIAADGTVDWPTFSGFRRYNAECFQCHGPDGAGGSYAPALVNVVKQIDYYQFVSTVVNGKQDVNAASTLVMPSLGENPNVMCYLDDIYTYLRARAYGDLPRGRPQKKEKKSKAFAEAENACMGG